MEARALTAGSVAERPEGAPVRRGLWLYAVTVIVVTLVVVPIADHQLAVHADPILVFFVLMVAADLLTAYLLVQHFLACGRVATLGLSSAYLYSTLMMGSYGVVYSHTQQRGADPIWTEVRGPYLFLAMLAGFPLLAAAQQYVVAALPARLIELAATRRRTAAATVAAAVLALVVAVTGAIFGAANWLPRLFQGGAPAVANRWAVGAVLLITVASLLAVIRNLRHRPAVEQWVVVAMSASVATGILFLAAPNRYSVGYYAARVTLLLSCGVVLLALLAETARLYRRLAATHQDLDRAHRELSRRAEHLSAANLELQAALAHRADLLDQRIRLTAELAQSVTELTATAKARSDLVAQMSHEVRTPLNAIMGFNALMEMEPENDGHTTVPTEWIHRIGSNGRHLLELINEVLELAKAEAGKLHLRRRAVPLRAVATEVASALAPLAQSKSLDLVVSVPELLVDADPLRLRQIITNLLSNAIKFTPASGRITVTTRQADREVALMVTDTGPGIPAADQQRIFAGFEQTGTPEAMAAGTGLGLALTRQLVEAHGGRIELESTPGHGATFTVVLPAAAR